MITPIFFRQMWWPPTLLKIPHDLVENYVALFIKRQMQSVIDLRYTTDISSRIRR